jgi:hypothetical protein
LFTFIKQLDIAVSKECGRKTKMNETGWKKNKIDEWYAKQPWLVGCNFVPSTAINQLEMWQEETFDSETIRREMGLANGLGFNSLRVYLHDLLWQSDAETFKARIEDFLQIASSYKMSILFVVFDACWNPEPKLGKQPAPTSGIHNSGWLQSPTHKDVTNPTSWQPLRKYVQELLNSFSNDKRILMWDLYNEPDNSGFGDNSLPLLEAAFDWAREVNPSQPLSTGIWLGNNNKKVIDLQIEISDVINFHWYKDEDSLRNVIHTLRAYQKPLFCSEYLARTEESRFENCLPVFKQEHIACYNWGLVAGKTQTIYPWGSPQGAPEPKEWFHDIFRKDGTPFKKEEVELIREYLSAK